MSLVSLAAIGVAVFTASLVSGVFGIAGGMIMLGVLLIFFDVATAMVMFSLLATTSARTTLSIREPGVRPR